MVKNPKKNNEKNKSHIPLRLNLLFFVVFLLFASLILRLAFLQIIKGEEFQAEVQRTETTLATRNVPRGEIFDAQERKLVSNIPRQSILYTRGKGVTSKEMAELSLRLAEVIDMPHVTRLEDNDTYDLTFRDLQDFWLVLNEEEINERLTEKEKKLKGSELYRTQVSKVEESDVTVFSATEKKAAAIFKKMNGAYALTTINIKNEDVTDEEIARVNENLSSLAGIETGTDWQRTYPQGEMMKSILGDVTTEEEGLLSSHLQTYLAQGYSRNDRVGKSYLEREYETVLRGTKSKSETETNRQGDVTNQIEQFAGAKGDNLILTTDIAFQKEVEDIARESLVKNRTGLNDRIYVGAMNPQTGEILAMTGQKINPSTGEIQDDALGFFSTAYSMGSTVKGATVLAGYMDGVLSVNDNVLVDEGLKFQGTPRITSLFNTAGRPIPVNDITALERSSNVYMAKIVMRMGGLNGYTPNAALRIDGENTLNRLRGYFGQFGLGVKTGIDLPNEGTGYIGGYQQPGQALYHSFGQFDTYTSLQLLQYVSTIANGGTRLAPRLVSEIRATDAEGNVGELKTEIPPRILNTVNVDPQAMERVQRGFYEVINGNQGTHRSYFANAEFVAAGKTGTAEAFYDGPKEEYKGTAVINKTFVSYAPYDNPEIAVVVVIPWLPANNKNYENAIVSKRVLDAYFRTGEFKDQSIPEEFLEEAE